MARSDHDVGTGHSRVWEHGGMESWRDGPDCRAQIEEQVLLGELFDWVARNTRRLSREELDRLLGVTRPGPVEPDGGD